MQFLTFSCLICALNLNFAQKLLRNASLLEVARTAKSCSKRQNVAQKLPSTIGKGLMFASSPPWVLKFRTGDVRIPPFPPLLNHLSPKINIQILHTGLHTFLEKLLERIYQRSKHFLRWSFH